MSGVGVALEKHPKGETVVVRAQVFSRPIRNPPPIPHPNYTTSDLHGELDPSKTYAVTPQINYTLSQISGRGSRASLACILHPVRRLRLARSLRQAAAQICPLLPPDVVTRRQKEFPVDLERKRYVSTMRGTEPDRIRQRAQAKGRMGGSHYVLNHRSIRLTHGGRKVVEDVIREAEWEVGKALKCGGAGRCLMARPMTQYSMGISLPWMPIRWVLYISSLRVLALTQLQTCYTRTAEPACRFSRRQHFHHWYLRRN
jgi:chitin synthase